MLPVFPCLSLRMRDVVQPKPSSNSELAFADLFARHERSLRATLLRRCSGISRVDADDVLQEVRIRLWRALEGGREIRNPASYLYRMASSALIDAIRRAKARGAEATGAERNDPGPIETITPEQMAVAADLGGRIDVFMADLSANRRRALGLYLQGFGSREIAELCGWSEAKARNLAYRGLADLKRKLYPSVDHEK